MRTHHSASNVLLLTVVISAALMLWSIIKMYSTITIVSFVFTAFFGWVLIVHQDAKSAEAAILKSLGRYGYLTQYQITALVLRDVSPGQVLQALTNLEKRGSVVSRIDPDLGKMWAAGGEA